MTGFEESRPLVRLPCDIYQEEYKACKGWRGRFNQYFIYGKYADCSKWREDYLACSAYLESGDKTYLDSVHRHEVERREARRNRISDNDVWEYRNEPPKEWIQELPEIFQSPLLESADSEHSTERKTPAKSFLESLYSRWIN